MFRFLTVGRHVERSAARRERAGRCIRVERLEGRQLLSAFHRHPSVMVPAIVGNHIGTSVTAEVRGASIVPAIVGNHIGTSVTAAARGVSAHASTVRFYGY
jgi:hypothetical protein